MKKDLKISFIGAGNMGEAMIRGLLASGFAAKNLMALDADQDRQRQVCAKYKIKAAKGLAAAVLAEAAVIAVKPQQLDGLLRELAELQVRRPLLITIVAGVPISRYLERLGKVKVVRVMPNTPALIGAGVSAFFAGPGCKAGEVKLAKEIISALGPAFEVSEEYLLDAVTGLSGSGPAYVFEMIEAMTDGGVMMGLPRPLALELASRTVAGAARMVIETGEHPAVLKAKVTSPGGTTIHGLAKLDQGGFRAAVMKAVKAATERSQELGRKKT